MPRCASSGLFPDLGLLALSFGLRFPLRRADDPIPFLLVWARNDPRSHGCSVFSDKLLAPDLL